MVTEAISDFPFILPWVIRCMRYDVAMFNWESTFKSGGVV